MPTLRPGVPDCARLRRCCDDTSAPAAKAPAKPAPKAAAPKAAAKKPAPVKAPAVKAAKAEPVKPAKEAKVAKPIAEEKAPAPAKADKKAAKVVEAEVEAPKKEKKTKVDKSGMSEDQAKWVDLHEKYKSMKAPPYNIGSQYEAKTPIEHKTFGWGFILSNEYDRLEVLFEDGKRMLISNRKLS